MRKIILLIAFLLLARPFQMVYADCIAPDGTACTTRPPGHENEPIAPPISDIDFPTEFNRPPGHENDVMATPIILVIPPSENFIPHGIMFKSKNKRVIQ